MDLLPGRPAGQPPSGWGKEEKVTSGGGGGSLEVSTHLKPYNRPLTPISRGRAPSKMLPRPLSGPARVKPPSGSESEAWRGTGQQLQAEREAHPEVGKGPGLLHTAYPALLLL